MKPRLYNGISRFYALRRLSKPLRRKLRQGLALEPGDLVHTCRGYNERLIRAVPEVWCGLRGRGWIIVDVDIQTDGMNSCSLIHCCTLPILSVQEIIEYFLTRWGSEKALSEADAYGMPDVRLIVEALQRGDRVFNGDGTLSESAREVLALRARSTPPREP